MMTEYLLLKPYKTQFVQKTDEENFEDRVKMCQTLKRPVEDMKVYYFFFLMKLLSIYIG